MTTAVFPADVEMASLRDMLRATLGGVRVYVGGDVFDEPLRLPFVVLRHAPGGRLDGPAFAGDGGWPVSMWQLDAVGERQDQAEALATRVRSQLVTSDGAGGFTNNLPVTGWRCGSRAQTADLGTSPEGQARRKLWVARRRYELHWIPA